MDDERLDFDIDDLGKVDFSKGILMSPEEAKEMLERRRETIGDEPQGPVCVRLTDGRLVCYDCFEIGKENPEKFPVVYQGDMKIRGIVLITSMFRMFYPETAPVCAFCEKIILAKDAHICQSSEGTIEHIREKMEGHFPSESMDDLVNLMFAELKRKGTYTDCPYHPGYVTVQWVNNDSP